MPHSPLDPIEALGRLAGRWRAHRLERTPLEGALGKRLAAPFKVPARRAAEGFLRATLNGYALGRESGPGEYIYRAAGAEGPGAAGPGGGGEGGAGAPILERVETGDILPPGTERVVPVEWTTVVASAGGGPARVRIPPEALPPPGHGVAGPGEAEEKLAPGTRIGPRLLSLLLSREVASVETCPALRIGVLAVGSELTDVLGGAAPAAAPARDLSGIWLPPLIRALGHVPHPLGIAGDEPAEGREALLRARRLGLDALIVTGGLGDGLSDRTAELVLRTGGKISFDGIAIRPGRRCLSGETMEMRVLGLGGRPIDTAAAFDLFARPALLSAHGALPDVWDWSDRGFSDTLVRDRPVVPPEAPLGHNGPPPWTALPVRRDPSGRGLIPMGRPFSQRCFLPCIPGQSGWAVLPPAGVGHPREGRAFFQPCEESGEMIPGEDQPS